MTKKSTKKQPINGVVIAFSGCFFIWVTEKLEKKGMKLKEDAALFNQRSKRGSGRYVKDNRYAVVNGKKIPASDQELEIDYTKAQRDELLDGYYCLVTSELNMADEEIWANYNELHDIENCFRVSKSELNLRPVFVRTEESVNAHVLTCFVSLLIYRIIQRLTDYKYSMQEIFDAIREYTLTYVGENYYFSYEQKNDII